MKTRKNKNLGSFPEGKVLNSRKKINILKRYNNISKRYKDVNMPKKDIDTERIMLTFTKNHYDKLNDLVIRGIYTSKAEVIREALREFFRRRETNLEGDENNE